MYLCMYYCMNMEKVMGYVCQILNNALHKGSVRACEGMCRGETYR